jgi:hypothetical protein
MPRSSNKSPRPAVLDLQDALQILPANQAVGKADRRSLGKSRKLLIELDRQGRPSDIARLLQLPTSRYVALKKGIKSGKASSRVLNDMLQNTLEQSRSLSYGFKKAPAIIQGGKGAGRNKKVPVAYVAVPFQFIKERIPWANNVKAGGFASFQSALNWYANVGGTGYFWIVFKQTKSTGSTRYYIYDVRTLSEQQSHNKNRPVTHELKAEKLLREKGYRYGVSENMKQSWQN